MEITIYNYGMDDYSLKLNDKIAVVIDVFRATSVITAAIYHGAKKVILTSSPEDSFRLYKKLPTKSSVLAGERNMHKIKGFHFGNSPQDFSKENIEGKEVILTTTNGTKAIQSCESAQSVYIASFLNIDEVINKIIERNKDIAIICSGQKNNFALEDNICAGRIVSSISKKIDIDMNDYTRFLKNHYEQGNYMYRAMISQGNAYHRLINHGYSKDIEYCLTENVCKVIPTLSRSNEILGLNHYE